MRFFSNLFLFSITCITVNAGDVILLTSTEMFLIPLVSVLVTGILTVCGIGIYTWTMNKKKAKIVFKTAEPMPESKGKDKPPTNEPVIDNASESNVESKKAAEGNEFEFQSVVKPESHVGAPQSTNLCSLPVEPLEAKDIKM